MRLHTFFIIFKKPWYLSLMLLVTVSIFLFATWIPNIRLIITILSSGSIAILQKLSFLVSLLGSITTNFTVMSATYTIMIAVLFGMNIALFTYYVRRMQNATSGIRTTSAVSLGGLISGFFGIGCAACGTFILTSVLALFGASGILVFLPFGGEEFGFLGAILLLYSTYSLTKKIQGRLVCPIRQL